MIHSPNQYERGAALLVAMVMLLVLSLLGISAMQSATVETQLAANTLAKEITFQSAESASKAAMDIPNVLTDVVCQDDPSVTDMTNLNRTDNQETEASVQYGGRTLAPGYSMTSQFAVRRFFVTGHSSIDDINTSTTILTGHIRPGASSNGSEC